MLQLELVGKLLELYSEMLQPCCFGLLEESGILVEKPTNLLVDGERSAKPFC